MLLDQSIFQQCLEAVLSPAPENLLFLNWCHAPPAAIVLSLGFLTLHRALQAPKHWEIPPKHLKKVLYVCPSQGGRQRLKGSETTARGYDSALLAVSSCPEPAFY